eukprot:COSAG01_NODE_5007_length_4548_cov_5.216903_7_plen_204_part_00
MRRLDRHYSCSFSCQSSLPAGIGTSAIFHLIRTFVEQHGSPCFFVDVGSNHGFYAVFAARLGCQVHAYEPQLELRERACAAYALNGVSVSLYAAGIGRLNGHNEIIGEEGGAYLAPCTTSTGASRCTESFRLDDIYGRDRHITVMKVDVEGWEIGALRGAVQLLNRGAFGALLVEVAPARWLSLPPSGLPSSPNLLPSMTSMW